MTLSDWLQEKTIEAGLVSVYKPYGISSTVITELYKRATKQKVGHGGTLDPLAEGALMLGIGKGTKLLSKYLCATKRYSATIVLGATTDSLDLELPLQIFGIEKSNVSLASLQTIAEELAQPYFQEVPKFSASKINGKTSYVLARAGKEVAPKAVETQLLAHTISNFQLLSAPGFTAYLQERWCEMQQNFTNFTNVAAEIGFSTGKNAFLLAKWLQSFDNNIAILHNSPAIYAQFDIAVTVPKGTYIRSLANDFATRLNTKGVLAKLVRKNAGN